MKIAIGADHRGVPLKNKLIPFLKTKGYRVADLGAYATEPPSDYPDIAGKVAHQVVQGRSDRGVLICGTGTGMSISANKVKGIRAAHCTSLTEARLSREHNDANILTMGSMITPVKNAKQIAGVWLKTKAQGGRHRRRVQKIARLEDGSFRRER